MRPSAPPLLFWNVNASTTCSRLTLPIFVRTRPIGRPWSWSIGGIPPPVATAPPPPVPDGGLFGADPPTLSGLAPVAGGTTTFDGGRRPDGFAAPGAAAEAAGRTPDDGFGRLPGSGAGVAGG